MCSLGARRPKAGERREGVGAMKRLVDALFPGARVFVPGMTGESALLFDELAQDPERARDVQFICVNFPGIGRGDLLSLHPQARQTGFFMTPALRAGIREGRGEVLGLDYGAIVRHVRELAPPDVVYVQLSPPDDRGYCTPGICSDFVPLIWQRARRRIAHVNPQMPRTNGSFRVHVSELDGMVEAPAELVTAPDSAPNAVEQRIGEHVAALVRDGDTVQFGIGSVPVALARSLASHRGLKLHTGMVTESVRFLWDAGALDRDARIVNGFAIGSTDFYRFVAGNDRIWMTDAGVTHDIVGIAAIPRFVAVNSAMQVDLFGQVNSERAAGTLQAGAGGLPVFATAASLSAGGRSMICMPSTAKGGAVSRIVPALGDGALCNVPRHLADVVVTEHGAAQLRALSMDARAQALIGIAAPEHRAALSDAWDAMRAKL